MHVLYYFQNNYDGGEGQIIAVSADCNKLEKEKARLAANFKDKEIRKKFGKQQSELGKEISKILTSILNFLRSNKNAVKEGVTTDSFPANFDLTKRNWSDILYLDKLNKPLPEYVLPEFDSTYLGFDEDDLFIQEVKEL